jgi:hypothetical protein
MAAEDMKMETLKEANYQGESAINAKEANSQGESAIKAKEADSQGESAINAKEADSQGESAINAKEANSQGESAIKAVPESKESEAVYCNVDVSSGANNGAISAIEANREYKRFLLPGGFMLGLIGLVLGIIVAGFLIRTSTRLADVEALVKESLVRI